MAKVQQISEITPSFAFTEFDFYKDYEESFKKCEIGRIHALLPLHESMCMKPGSLSNCCLICRRITRWPFREKYLKVLTVNA